MDNVGVRLCGLIWWIGLEYRDCLEKATSYYRTNRRKIDWRRIVFNSYLKHFAGAKTYLRNYALKGRSIK